MSKKSKKKSILLEMKFTMQYKFAGDCKHKVTKLILRHLSYNELFVFSKLNF